LKKKWLLITGAAVLLVVFFIVSGNFTYKPVKLTEVVQNNTATNNDTPQVLSTIALPAPSLDSSVSVEKALLLRRSIRSYTNEPLTLADISQLVWAAQGLTSGTGRTAPSAAAYYPLTVYVVTSNVIDLAPGIYKYNPTNHELLQLVAEDKKSALLSATEEESVNVAAVSIVLTGNYERLKAMFGEKGERFVHLEAGHAAQNICLQAVSLKLGTVTIGSFKEGDVNKLIPMPSDEHALYVMPVGRLP